MNLLTLSGLGSTEVSIVDEAKVKRDALLAEAASITAVADQVDADAAADTLKRIKELTRGVEAARVEVKGPVLELSRQIDGLAKELSAALDVEANRISRVLGAWQVEERRKADEARRRAAAEEERIKREAAAKMAEAEAKSKSAAEAAQKQAAIEELAITQIVETKQAAESVAALAKPAGSHVRETWNFEVTDIAALYAAAPYLVSLQPNNTAIRGAIKTNQNIPGLRVWKEAKTII